jgi:biopolymer transport protein ExbB
LVEETFTMLASIGATAPFVGLFGTAWRVYHALVAIGMSGSGMIETVGSAASLSWRRASLVLR